MKMSERFVSSGFILALIFALAAFKVHADSCEISDLTATTPSAQLKLTDGEDSEVVEDLKTGLMWARCFYGSSWSVLNADCAVDSAPTVTWKDALKAVDKANTDAFLGYTDWRLPNIKELASIVERQCYIPAINTARFPLSGLSSAGIFWSSTPVTGGTSIRVINFADGQMLSRDYTTENYVRLVRDAAP